MLPQDFLNRMEHMLGEEYPAFLESYEKERYQSLRVNTLKVNKEQFLEQVTFHLAPVTWAEDGFYYESTDTPGKHPYHEAGVYYIQEPSAMAPVEYLMKPLTQCKSDKVSEHLSEAAYDEEDSMEHLTEAASDEKDSMEHTYAMEHERILDLCAAPGGKSTQIAAAMQGKGLLICNEIHPVRAKILSENVERMGIRNAMVTNETPQRLAEIFSEYFTRILVDAPCSGEGMFRKNEDACEEWSLENVAICATRQDEILDCAASMLMPGGRIVYSTCTFAPAENEGSISRFLKRHPEFSIEKVEKTAGMAGGVPEWAENEDSLNELGEDARKNEENQEKQEKSETGLEDTIRLWPHLLNGEGHYLAVLRKGGTLDYMQPGYCRNGLERGIAERDIKTPGKGCVEYLEFAKEIFAGVTPDAYEKFTGKYLKFGEQLYLIPQEMPSVKGLKVLRPGLHLGTIKKNRFEPSHALALAMKPEDAAHAVNLASDSREIRGYLNGETFSYDGEKGWYLMTVDGYSIGWGKLAGGIMKNHYPKGLRKYI